MTARLLTYGKPLKSCLRDGLAYDDAAISCLHHLRFGQNDFGGEPLPAAEQQKLVNTQYGACTRHECSTYRFHQNGSFLMFLISARRIAVNAARLNGNDGGLIESAAVLQQREQLSALQSSRAQVVSAATCERAHASAVDTNLHVCTAADQSSAASGSCSCSTEADRDANPGRQAQDHSGVSACCFTRQRIRYHGPATGRPARVQSQQTSPRQFRLHGRVA